MAKSMKLLAIPIILVSLFICIYFLLPFMIISTSASSAIKKAGLEVYEVKVEKQNWIYLAGGKGETILLVHGYAMNKNMWGELPLALTGEYHLIVPDLPGFGETEIEARESMLITAQAERLGQFIDELELTDFHLIGISMGSGIAGYYASLNPEKVTTLSLLSPYGVETEKLSTAFIEIENGNNPLIYRTLEGYDNTASYVVYQPTKLPYLIRAYLVRQSRKRYDFYRQTMEDHREQEGGDFLRSRLKSITSPVLVIYGKEDKVTHESSLDVYKNELSNTDIIILEEAGHLVHFNKPGETASAIKGFILSH